MARPRRLLPLLAAALLPAIPGAGGREGREPERIVRPAAGASSTLRAPLPWMGRFEENLGQVRGAVPFLFRGPGFDAGFTATGAVFSLPGAPHPSLLRMEVESALPGAALEPADPLAGRTNYLRGRDPARWVRGARGFARLARRGIRPGVDLSWRAEGGAPAYGFTLAPGADPAGLVLRFDGASSLRVEEDGSLAVGVPGGVLRHGRPAAWQEAGGVRSAVPVAFVVLGPGRVGLRAGRRDAARPLVIDPVLSYGSYFGTVVDTVVTGIRPGPAGSLLLGGSTRNPNLVPAEEPLPDTVAGYDAFVASLAPGGSRLEYATFLGGYGDDLGLSVSPDGSGGAWLAGSTRSADLPVKDPFQEKLAGTQDGFVARVPAGGADLAFATYLGGKTGHAGSPGATSTIGAVVALAGGGAMVCGNTTTVDFPLLDPFQAALASNGPDSFVAGFSDAGVLLHSSYLGGSGSEVLDQGAACPDGSAVFAGTTSSADFPQVGSVPGIHGSLGEAVLVKVPAAGGSLAWTQVFGGSLSDEARSVAVLPSGAVLAGGRTASTGFPSVNPLGAATGSFLSVFSAAGDALLFSTSPPGGADVDEVGADSDGALYASGSTQGLSGALVDPLQGILSGTRDAFLLKIAPDFSGYLFSSYLGGTGAESGPVRLAVASPNAAWIAASSTSLDIQLKAPIQGVHQATFLQRVALVPAAPSGLSGIPLVGLRAQLLWYDESDDEASFEVERRTGAGPFAPAGTSGADVASFQDSGLLPLTRYEYRVRAQRPGGPTGWSNVAAVDTLDVAPAPPTAFTATGTSPSSLRLDWTRGSLNETGFEVLRRVRGGTQFLRSVLPAGTVSYDDVGLQPARSYGYVVRAVNDIGGNASAETWGTTPGTLLAATISGTLRDSTAAGKDQVKVSGTLAFSADAPDGVLDPILDGVEVRLGGEASPFLTLAIPPASLAWTLKKGTFTWRSPKRTVPRVTFSLDPAKGTFRLSAAGLDFAVPPASPVEVSLASGNDAGLVLEAWKESKPGSGKFRR